MALFPPRLTSRPQQPSSTTKWLRLFVPSTMIKRCSALSLAKRTSRTQAQRDGQKLLDLFVWSNCLVRDYKRRHLRTCNRTQSVALRHKRPIKQRHQRYWSATTKHQIRLPPYSFLSPLPRGRYTAIGRVIAGFWVGGQPLRQVLQKPSVAATPPPIARVKGP